MIEQYLLLLIILAPLFGAACSYLLGFLNRDLATWFATLSAGVSFSLVLLAFSRLSSGSAPLTLDLGVWFRSDAVIVNWAFVFDALSAVMCLLITGVGTLIHIYSLGYMREDRGKARFFSYLNLFLASMLVLVLGSNLAILFIGWEGVGLCSYLLIGFWFAHSDYAKAAQKAFVMNRIGDLGLLIAMFCMIMLFGSLDFEKIGNLLRSQSINPELLTLIGGMLLLGAFGKSAQLPLFTWLPDAMAGPTPVSALIHAATMVTAGIYLVARMSTLFAMTPELSLFLALIAASTAFIAATIALVQTDIKKVLAYSTVSQLGFMFLALASGAYWVAIFHVLTHGFFKACLFLSAGSVIHGCHHEQDMQKMGGLARKMPKTFLSYTLATLAIAGIAPLSGYYSKHAVLEAFSNFVSTHSSPLLNFLLILINFTAFLTAFYMTRSWILTFLGEYRGDKKHAPHEVPLVMWAPVMILAGLSVVAGFLLASPLSVFLNSTLPVSERVEVGFDFSALMYALAHSWVGFAGIFAALICFYWSPRIAEQSAKFFAPLVSFLKRSYLLDELYNLVIVQPLRFTSWFIWKVGDELVLEGVERGSVAATRALGALGAVLQAGYTRQYAAWAFVGVLGLIFLLIRGF